MPSRRSAIVAPLPPQDEQIEAMNIAGDQPQHQLVPHEGVDPQLQAIEGDPEDAQPEPQPMEGHIEAMNIEGGLPQPLQQVGLIHPEPNWMLIHNFREFFLWVIVIGFVTLAFVVAYKTRNNDYKESFECGEKIVVAPNGGGQYTSVANALKNAPDLSNTRFCIHIQKGIYNESIVIGQLKQNIVLIGDGANNTIIISSGKRNNSATAVVLGKQFMAINLTFESSGIAVNSSSADAIFYNCRIMGKHSTLYLPSKRHFFRDCEIFGADSIIHGSALAFFQNCRIYVGENLKLKPQVIIRQGGNFRYIEHGFVLDRCTIQQNSGRRGSSNRSTYLGCPQGAYSKIVIMRSFIPSMVNPKGWTQCGGYWPKHIFYGEFNNTGPGAKTSERVHQDGIKVLNIQESSQFMLRSFFKEKTDWISSSGIPFSLN